MNLRPHVIINALAATGAGGFTVARQLAAHIPRARPEWKFTLLIVSGFRLHDQIQPDELSSNCTILRAPPETATRWPRYKFEKELFPRLVAEQGATAALQLNGMMPPCAKLPVLAHNQDPWPYRPEAWDLGLRDRALAFMRRRAHLRGFKQADCVGFTSHYLHDLMVKWLGREPKKSCVFYNGLPESWLARASGPLPPWSNRPMELLSVSSVGLYKRQELVVRALPALIQRPQMNDLVYRIVGHHNSEEYVSGLKKLADDLGVGKRVIIEGRVPDERVEQLMVQARAYVLMSVCESFGLPAIEAMSFGTPAVVSDCCAMPEVCGDGAVLSPADEVAPLVDNLHRVLTDAILAEELRRRGAKNCGRFHWHNTAAQFAQALEKIIPGAGTQPQS